MREPATGGYVWPLPPGVRFACSSRSGGVSSAPYDSLNLGDHVGDTPADVAENRRRFAQELGAKPVYLQQVHGTHVALYALFFVVPLIGWAYSSAAGFPIVVFGVLPLPDLLAVDKDLAVLIKPFHRFAAWALVGLIVLHVAAALKHQLIDRDGLIGRMWFGKS